MVGLETDLYLSMFIFKWASRIISHAWDASWPVIEMKCLMLRVGLAGFTYYTCLAGYIFYTGLGLNCLRYFTLWLVQSRVGLTFSKYANTLSKSCLSIVQICP